MAFLVAQTVENVLAMQGIQIQSLGWEGPLEKGMATHSYSCLGNPMDGLWWATVQHMGHLGDFLTRRCKLKVKDKAAVCWS